MIRRGAALVAALLLVSCGRQQPQPSSSAPLTHNELRLTFRTSFMRSCLAGVSGPAGQVYCDCTDDRLEASLSDRDLAHLKPDDPRFRSIAHACAKKAGLTIRPGH